MDRFRRFDEAYYQRFYEAPKTRVVSAQEHASLAKFVFAFAAWNNIDVKSVLDIGAGVGHWKRWLEKNTKGIKYVGTEVSQVMCEKHGFLNRDIARWRDRKKHDLIVCQGVLQYLPDPDVAPAVANIAARLHKIPHALDQRPRRERPAAALLRARNLCPHEVARFPCRRSQHE